VTCFLSSEEVARDDKKEEEEEESAENIKYADVKHMALVQEAFWSPRHNKIRGRREPSASKSKFTNKVRMCYNCGNINHFIVDCFYEKVEYGARQVHVLQEDFVPKMVNAPLL
jgi:hypothetical protein